MVRSLLLLGLTFAAIGCRDSNTLSLSGKGATFPEPLYQKWFKEYHSKVDPKVTINYTGAGSSAGKSALKDLTVDFAASDAAMTDEEIAKIDRGVVLIPATAGEIVLVYNLKDKDGKAVTNLKLSREAYTGIFLGTVTDWNDPVIAKSNPDLKLPDTKIAPVTRSDGSGTTFVFTKHLAEISPEFKKTVGSGTEVKFPKGTAAQKNQGVAGQVQQIVGSIGYVEYGYAKLSKEPMPMAWLENKAGNFIEPSIKSGMAALENVTLPDNLVAWLPDPDGAESYPIVTYTWLLLYKKYPEKKAKEIKALVSWCLDKGQAMSEAVGYIPLPPKVIEKVKPALEQIVVDGK